MLQKPVLVLLVLLQDKPIEYISLKNFAGVSLCFLCCILKSNVIFAKGSIILPTFPEAPIFRDPEKDTEKNIFQIPRKSSKKEYESQPKKKTKNLSEIHRKALEEFSGPMNFYMAITPVLTYVKVSGKDRKNYQSEPTFLFHINSRFFSGTLKNEYKFWFGLRLAPFNGTGVYKKLAGTYGFLYMGPMVSLGKFSPSPKRQGLLVDLPERIDGKVKPSRLETIHSRAGYFFSGGIAAQSRLVARDPGAAPSEEEFSHSSLGFDSPGVWIEYAYSVISHRAISANYTVGMQLGKEKYFTYMGVGLGLWY